MKLNQMCLLFCLLFIGNIKLYAQECDECYPESCFWLSSEYIGWTIKDNPLPIPLITTASFDDPIPGAIGQPGSHVVLGNKDISMEWQNGFQILSGMWLNEQKNIGLEGSYFLLPTTTKDQSLSTTGLPGSINYAVPIFDVTGVFGLNGIPGETIFILPGPLFGGPGFQGIFNLKLSSKFQGAEINGLLHIAEWNNVQLEGLAGFRWLQLEESLTFTGLTQSVPGLPFPGFYNFEDQFKTSNNFYGGQVGLRTRFLWRDFNFMAAAKTGLGVMGERVAISGVSQTSGGNLFFSTSGTAQTILPGGIFAQLTNIGIHNKQEMTALFETSLRGSYTVSNNIEISIGYNFLWVSHVARPGDQIDRKINPTLTALANASRDTVGTGPGPIPFGVPGAAPAASGPGNPREVFKTTDFWAQGLTIGLTFKY